VVTWNPTWEPEEMTIHADFEQKIQEYLMNVEHQEQEVCHALDLLSLCTLSRPLWMSSVGYKDSDIQIICYNQSPHPPRFLSKGTVGCKTKHEHTLPS